MDKEARSSTLRVIRIRTARTFRYAEGLLKRGVADIEYPGTTPEAFAAFVEKHIASPEMGVFVGFSDDAAQGIAVAQLPSTPFMMYAQVVLIYNEGGRVISYMVGDRMRRWLQDNGYDLVLACHPKDKYDVRMKRAMRHFGKAAEWGSLTCYRLG